MWKIPKDAKSKKVEFGFWEYGWIFSCLNCHLLLCYCLIMDKIVFFGIEGRTIYWESRITVWWAHVAKNNIIASILTEKVYDATWKVLCSSGSESRKTL